MKLSKSEKAALVVAARAKEAEEDSQPRLIEAAPKRPAAPTKPKTRKARSPEPQGEPAPIVKMERKPGADPAAERDAPPEARKKPKMRLVNGRLVPVDEPGLFRA
jgi:hypothetical protein